MAVQLWDKVTDHGGQELHLLGYQPEAVSPKQGWGPGSGLKSQALLPRVALSRAR